MPTVNGKRTSGVALRRDGTRLHWELGGPEDGPPMVLVRGLGRSSSYWFELRDLLEQERRLLVFDNRGVGRSDRPPLPWSTADLADDLAVVIADSGLQRADVFGISLGGMIAQAFALRHPHRLRRLMLGCTTPGGHLAIRVPPEAAFVLARSATLPFPEVALRYSAPWVLSPEFLERRPEIVDLWIAIASSEPNHRLGVIGQLLAAAAHDTSRSLHRITAPTLVLTGDADRLVPMGNSERMAARLPNARVEILRGAGHDFPTERPEETFALMREFLNADDPISG